MIKVLYSQIYSSNERVMMGMYYKKKHTESDFEYKEYLKSIGVKVY